MSHLIDIANLNKLMSEEFDFKHYYNEFGKFEMKELIENVNKRVKGL